MKIKVYIVTYKKDDILNKNLETLWCSICNAQNIEVTVLSNYPECNVLEKNRRSNLRIVYNATRMPHAWGYLSRDWNYCILDGFKTWRNPEEVDWVVMAQNDVTWVQDWDVWLGNNKDYDFISQPRGDQSMAINIEAVKKIGFFDERFTTISCQEQDFFRRALLKLGNRCSINDDHPGFLFGTMQFPNVITNNTYSGFCEHDDTLHTEKTLNESILFLLEKYNCKTHRSLVKSLQLRPVLEEIDWYPFFWDGTTRPKNLKARAIDNSVVSVLPPPRCMRLRKFVACFVPSRKLRRKIRGQL